VDTVTEYWVEAGELSRPVPLHWADAGNSRMFRVCLDGQELLYKEYTEEFREGADQHALGRLIGWRDTLSRHDRDHLDRVAAWPRYRVRHHGALMGVLVPFAPGAYFEQGDDGPRPRMLAQLIRLRSAGRILHGASSDVKHTALGRAADVLFWFHSHRVIVNDVRELNVLCTPQGTDVFYVDCDVMTGPWRNVGPPAAPGYMMKAIPGLERPSRETDIARLSWMAAAILLDDIALPEVRPDQLLKVTDPAAAQLLATASRPGTIDDLGWRGLIERWTAPRATGYAGVPGTAGRPFETSAAAEPVTASVPLPPTRPVPMFRVEQASPSFRVPDRFRRPDPAYRLPAAPLLPAAVEPPSPWSRLSHRHRVLLLGGFLVILAVCGVVTLSMSVRGMVP
jgi:hypothetical protein